MQMTLKTPSLLHRSCRLCHPALPRQFTGARDSRPLLVRLLLLLLLLLLLALLGLHPVEARAVQMQQRRLQRLSGDLRVPCSLPDAGGLALGGWALLRLALLPTAVWDCAVRRLCQLPGTLRWRSSLRQ
jgi:hypothetical protein